LEGGKQSVDAYVSFTSKGHSTSANRGQYETIHSIHGATIAVPYIAYQGSKSLLEGCSGLPLPKDIAEAEPFLYDFIDAVKANRDIVALNVSLLFDRDGNECYSILIGYGLITVRMFMLSQMLSMSMQGIEEKDPFEA